MFRLIQIFSLCFLNISSLYAQFDRSLFIDEVKKNIVSSLSQTLEGKSQPTPVLILIGGYVGSGKTTLSSAIKESYGVTVFSLNSIRQAMLDQDIDIRKNKKEEREILFEVYPQLLGPCIANFQHIIIDANANRQGIQEALGFLNERDSSKKYKVIKIHLHASEKELYKRVRTRIQRADLHQGTEFDLEHDLRTTTRAIYPEDYDLVIDTEYTSFEDEMEVIHSFLRPYF